MLYNPGKTNITPHLQTVSHRNNMNMHKRPLSILAPEDKDSIELVIPRQNVIPAVETIMWRFQTSLPIVRVKEVTVLAQARHGAKNQLFHMSKTRKHSLQNQQKQQNPISKISEFLESHPQLLSCVISVKIEDIQCHLTQINLLPLAQAIFLLKEMLIGFEALIDIFGFFEPRDSLVAVTPHGYWRLWIDQNYASQQKKQCNLNEKQFIYMLISMTQNHCISTSQSKTFFTQLKDYASSSNCNFLKILEQIHRFVDSNKIYQVSRVAIGANNTVKRQGNQKKQERRSSSIKKRSFNNPFLNGEANRQRSINKIDKSKAVPGYSLKQFHFKKVTLYENNQNFKSHKMSPIASPMSPSISHNPTFTELSQKWQSNTFISSIHTKPASQISKPQRRPNMRKYSQQLIKLQGFQNPNKQKCGGSTICNISFGEEMPQQRSSSKHKSRQYNSHKQLQSFHSIHNPSLSPQNSSSTKQMRQEDDRFDSCNYTSLKKKDLGNGRFKNNKSLISNQPHSRQTKQGMTVSHQFLHNKRSESDDMSPSKTRQDLWVNKIDDLFSDTKSIKQLKGSIRIKSKQQQPFQKEHLKDVKLDLLQKYGRKVNAPITISQDEAEYHPKKQQKQLNYKSMQLIQQELQEVISHIEEDSKIDDIMASQSIKSMRSRKYTNQTLMAQKEISFKDDFIKAESRVAESSVFNFQTEMYTINPKNL